MLESFYELPGGDSIAFDGVRFYISDIALYLGDKRVYTEKDSYHLVDVSDEVTTHFRVSAAQHFDKIVFHLGIDSATSTSGALGGDLDPGKGMFWTWQSGYINCKIEGRSNRCPTRHHDFSLHLGGYSGADLAIQEIALPVSPGDIVINLPLDKFLEAIDLRQQHTVMSPGPGAVALSKTLAALFEVSR